MTSLFANLPEERAAALDQRIHDLLIGKPGGRFGSSLNDKEKAVLRGIRYHRSSAQPVTIRELIQKTKLDARAIKNAVRSLRLSYDIPVGASRDGEEGGYFLMLNREDLDLFLASALRQIQGELQVVRAVGGSSAAQELLGQLALDEVPA